MFGDKLAQIRAAMGYPSARAFFQHFSEEGHLSFNYSYYIRIEKNKVLPSVAVVTSFCRILNPKNAEALTLAYCRTIFPEMKHLFQAGLAPMEPHKLAAAKSPSSVKQRQLTLAQIAALSKSQVHYYLFLILTLAREPLESAKLAAAIQKKSVEKELGELRQAKLLRVIEEKFQSISKDMKFPSLSTEPSLKGAYDQLDRWDEAFGKTTGFETAFQKRLIWRISPQQTNTVLQLARVLVEVARTSDESRDELLDEVLTLNLSIGRGRLP